MKNVQYYVQWTKLRFLLTPFLKAVNGSFQLFIQAVRSRQIYSQSWCEQNTLQLLA